MYSTVIFALCLLVPLGYGYPSLKVIGGNDAPIENFPFQVSIQYRHSHVCGGVILGPQVVLTAASCVDSLFYDDYQIVVGSTDLASAQQSVGVEFAEVHENYTRPENDIALIKLKQALVYSDQVKAVQLPAQGEEPAVNLPVTLSGYGLRSYAPPESSTVLGSADINVLSQGDCKASYGKRGYTIVDTMLCAGVADGTLDFCEGDQGTALSSNGKLIGIASFSRCGEAGYPGVYTKVSAFRDWIKNLTGI